MKLAGIIGVVFLVLSIGLSVYSIVSTLTSSPQEITKLPTQTEPSMWWFVLSIFIVVLAIVALLLFYLGFFKMGWYTHNFLLKISSLVIMGLMVLSLIFAIGIFWMQQVMPNESSGIIVDGAPEILRSPLTSLSWEVYLIIFVCFLFLTTLFLFYIGLIKSRKKVKFTNVAGILGLIGTVISFVGYCVFLYFLFFDPAGLIFSMLYLVSLRITSPLIFTLVQVLLTIFSWLLLLFMSLSLFDASKKFEKRKI